MKNKLFIVLIFVSKIALGSFQSGGNKVLVGTFPSMVDSLPQSLAALGGDYGAQVWHRTNHQTYWWNGSQWTSMTQVLSGSGNTVNLSLGGGTYTIPDQTWTSIIGRPNALSAFTNDVGYITTVPAQTYASITGKPSFATVATSGSYNDLVNKPTINTYTAGSGIDITSNVISSSGLMKVWSKSSLLSSAGILVVDTFSVSTATPTISLPLPTGTTTARLVSATGFRSGATVSTSPQVSISSFSGSNVSLIMSQQNTATVSILGINVLSGLPTILVPDPTNVKVVLAYAAY